MSNKYVRGEQRVKGTTWRDQGGKGAPDESKKMHMTFSGSIHAGTRGNSW